jgi:hypothetical protein
MRCEHQCFEIGGPWIDTNPSCPEHGREAEARNNLPDVPGNTWEFRTLWSLLSEHIDLNVNLGLDGTESWDEKSRRLFAKLDTLFDRIIP